MSKVVKCDGCPKLASSAEPPKDWLRVNVVNGHGTFVAKGDFHSADCLAKFLASDLLDAQIKAGAAA